MSAYERYGRALMRKAERLLMSRADAQDLVHGLFVDLLERQREEAIYDLPYLYRAVTNRCLTYLRDEKNRARLLDGNDALLRGMVRTPMEDVVMNAELVGKLVRELDESAAEIFVCHFFDDMPMEEIAEQVGLSRKTVGKRIEQIRETARRLATEGRA